MKIVFRIDETALSLGVKAGLLGCPFMLSPTGTVDIVNSYLQDLWLGNWVNDRGARTARYRPRQSSIVQMAQRLANFIQWCWTPEMHVGRALDPLDVQEDDLESYARHMETGLWSLDHNPLSPRTIGQRQSAVILWRKWAEARRKARKLELTTLVRRKRVISGGGGHTVEEVASAAVVRRQNPTDADFPTADEVSTFLSKLSNPTDSLAAKLVLQCGLRVERTPF